MDMIPMALVPLKLNANSVWLCVYIYSFQESVARFSGDSRTFKRIKSITLTFYFPTGIEHFHCEEKRKKKWNSNSGCDVQFHPHITG